MLNNLHFNAYVWSTDLERQQKDIVTSDAGTAGKESQASAEISALVNYVQPVHFR